MACYKVLLFLVSLCCLYLSVTSTKLTTILRDKNLTSLEERLTNLEQTIEHRLNVTEVLLGQLLTGRDGANLETLNVLSLRSQTLRTAFSPVLFSAYKSSSEGGISTNVKIRFEGTYINLGNHYHTENGVFIAPVTGIYMFHWTIATGGAGYTAQLMVAGSPRASNYVPYPGGADSSSAMVIISVNKDDHVWIQIYGSSKHVYGGSTSYGSHQSTFSGIMLQKT